MRLSDCYDPNSIRTIAVHEAGHAVASVVLGQGLKSVNIRPHVLPDGRIRSGLTDTPFMEADIAGRGESAAKPYLIQGFSGPIAEIKVNWRYHEQNGSSGDYERIRRIAAIAICGTPSAESYVEITPEEWARNEPRWRALLESAYTDAVSLVEDHWPAIKEVATLLGARQELSGDEVAAIVNNPRSQAASLR